MVNNLTGNPEIDKALAEERQRQILEEAQAERLARGEIVEPEDFEPTIKIEDEEILDEDDPVKTPDERKHIRKD